MKNIVEEKEAKIQNLKKQLKLPVESHVQIVELKAILQEKEVLQTELQNTKEIVGTIRALDKKIVPDSELYTQRRHHLQVSIVPHSP